MGIPRAKRLWFSMVFGDKKTKQIHKHRTQNKNKDKNQDTDKK